MVKPRPILKTWPSLWKRLTIRLALGHESTHISKSKSSPRKVNIDYIHPRIKLMVLKAISLTQVLGLGRIYGSRIR